MKRLSRVKKQLRTPGLYVLATAITAVIFCIHLGRLTNGKLSHGEVATLAHSQTLGDVAHNPLYLPVTLVRWIVDSALPLDSVGSVRLTSVLFALMAIASLYFVLRRWYGPRTAFFGFVLFATSAWTLHIGRMADFEIAYLWAMPVMVAAHCALQARPTGKLAGLFWIVTHVALLYIPGMIWFVLLNIFWQRRTLLRAVHQLTKPLWAAATVLLTLAGLIPFGYGFMQQGSLHYLLTWLGLPLQLPSIHDLLGRAAYSVLFILVRTPADPAHWLGHLSLLGAFVSVAFLAGCLFYARHPHAERTQLLLSNFILAIVLISIGTIVTRSVIVPLVYMVAAGGVAYLLSLWLKTFPRNILARQVGIGLITIVIGLACVYNLRHYFIAWPHNPDTQAAFTVPYPTHR